MVQLSKNSARQRGRRHCPRWEEVNPEERQMAQLDMRQPSKIYRGTVEEVFSLRNEIPSGAMIELKVFAETPTSTPGKAGVKAPQKPKELRGYGMLACISSVDEFMRRKQEDILLEERRNR